MQIRSKRPFISFCGTAVLSLGVWLARGTPEAFEVGPFEVDDLPKGKVAEGIIGDFILRNDKVEAVISGNLNERRANFKTFRGTNGMNPGTVYDLALRGANNDQLTIFAPHHQVGPVSWVRVQNPGSNGEAVVETVITAAKNKGVYKRHEYRMKDGWPGILITTTVRNEKKRENHHSYAEDVWTSFERSGVLAGIGWADAADPADKVGYAYGFTAASNYNSWGLFLRAGETAVWSRFLAVGTSPAEAVGKVAVFKQAPVGTLAGVIKDAEGNPADTTHIKIRPDEFAAKHCVAYPDTKGQYNLQLPEGKYDVEFVDAGRASITNKVTIRPRITTTINPAMTTASAIIFDVKDDTGRSTPCKAQFIGVNGTKSPELGPMSRAHGCKDQYHSEKGKFRVALPPGHYKVIVTRGIEFSHLEQLVTIEKEHTIKFEGVLRRLVNTTGWVSADYHNHSVPSGDTSVSTEDRIINLAAEQIEFAPTTEHNRLYDWGPYIKKLGLQEYVMSVPGIELTGSGPHLIAYPFKPVPYTQYSGGPEWDRDPRLDALTLRDWQGAEPDWWVQLNHPDMVENFVDRNNDGKNDGGYIGLADMIDGLETQNSNDSGILRGAPYSVGPDNLGQDKLYQSWDFIWLQMLNRGHRYSAVAVCDAHSVWGNGVGTWRMYLPSKTDKPGEIDWRENSRHAKAGHAILTCGPFLQVQTDDGVLPGGTVTDRSQVNLKVKVQCTDWIDIDRVQVLVNGRQPNDLNFTRASHPNMF